MGANIKKFADLHNQCSFLALLLNVWFYLIKICLKNVDTKTSFH